MPSGNACDNCPLVANPSQDDADSDNMRRRLRHRPEAFGLEQGLRSTRLHHDPGGAVIAAAQSGTRILIASRKRTLLESVIVNRNFALVFEGWMT